MHKIKHELVIVNIKYYGAIAVMHKETYTYSMTYQQQYVRITCIGITCVHAPLITYMLVGTG
eukprot:9279-Heterococcus_DN1.PRE.4